MLSKKEICEAFSTGNFESTFNYLDENISWNIIGTQILTGKEKIIEFCIQTSNYFKETKTTFTLKNIILDKKMCSIDGTAEFINCENRSTFINSCDIYKFENEKLIEITSYCLVKKP